MGVVAPLLSSEESSEESSDESSEESSDESSEESSEVVVFVVLPEPPEGAAVEPDEPPLPPPQPVTKNTVAMRSKSRV